MQETVEALPTLIVVPARAESAEEIEPILQTLVSVTATATAAMVLVVDDRSPEPQAEMIELASAELDCAYVMQQDGEGTSAAFNVGLSVALEHNLDVCLVAAGLVLESPGWLDRLRARTGSDGAPAAIAGGAVVEMTGTIRHAGYFFSRFRRAWRARLGNVPEILLDVSDPLLCPVGSELQLIRRDWIEKVGHYDELMHGPHAALDYSIRVSEAGGQCVLEPTVRARALQYKAGDPDETARDEQRLRLKHAAVNFYRWTPEVI
jgi:GT2 family glycosyltransferase